ncbi:MAG: HIRAN domain-containing protein [Saccharofermentanales bacterium]
MAWKTAKIGTIEKVVGVKYSNRQNILAQLDQCNRNDVRIQIEHEKGNPFDDNAVAVYASVYGQNKRACVGYLSSGNAAIWSSLIDQGMKISTALQEIVGGWDYDIAYGMRIRLWV